MGFNNFVDFKIVEEYYGEGCYYNNDSECYCVGDVVVE